MTDNDLQRKVRRQEKLIDDLLNERDEHLTRIDQLTQTIVLARSNPEFLHSEEWARA